MKGVPQRSTQPETRRLNGHCQKSQERLTTKTIEVNLPEPAFQIRRECVRCVRRVDSFTTWLQIAWFESTVELIKSFEAAHKKERCGERNCTYLFRFSNPQLFLT